MKIELEIRKCQSCEKKFKVMPTSQQYLCSMACNMFIEGEHGEQSKHGSDAKKEIVSVEIEDGLTRNIGKKRECEDLQGARMSMKKKSLESENTMDNTKNTKTSFGQSGPETTKTNSFQDSGLGTIKIRQELQTKSDREEEKKSLTLPSTSSSIRLEEASLDSMSLLSKSANRLMDLMSASVSTSQIQNSMEGVKHVELHRIDSAIKCAQALSGTIQVQCNIVKAMAEFKKAIS